MLELAEILGVDKEAAYFLVRFLEHDDVQLAVNKGKRAAVNGRGAGEKVYLISDQIVKELTKIAKKLESTLK